MSLHILGFCCCVITNWCYRAWFSGEGNQAAVLVWLVMGCVVNRAPYRLVTGHVVNRAPYRLVTGCVVDITPVAITQITTTNKHEKI